MAELQTFFDDLRMQLREGSLHMEDEKLIQELSISSSNFIEHEGELWDFKESWPFSYSDDYFNGLAKLICAFANNMGGLIIFNVSDEGKKYKESKVITNPDKFINAVNDITKHSPRIEIRVLDFFGSPLPIAIIYPKASFELPCKIRLRSKYNYSWMIRDGHQKIEADSKKISTLFCRDQVRNDHIDSEIIEISIPNSAATLPKFVKRFDIIEKIFEWLHDDRQPRSFLYGRGGSGKTTIAYEVCRQIAENNITISQKNLSSFESTVFITAKKLELDVYSIKTKNYSGTDFIDTKSLYRSLLICHGWYISDDIDEKNEAELLDLLEEMFEKICTFIVIDDIDTLTTAGEDGGLEQILLLLARSSKPSKVLYTLRNAPTHALKNAIEVPGLKQPDEIEQFVKLCAQQFKVAGPTEAELSQIMRITEGRPLGIESVIALRRTVTNYAEAIQGFEKHAGDDAREYVFQREWDALSPTNRSRNVLAALALVKEPLSSSELISILRFDADSLQQAIGEVLEMFLDPIEVGSDTKYTVGRMTEAFVKKRCEELDHYHTIKERVATFSRSFHPKLPLLNKLRARADRLVYQARKTGIGNYYSESWRVINDTSLGPRITENPAYKELVGEFALNMTPPKLTEAREYLLDACKLKYRVNIDILKNWHRIESSTGIGSKHCEAIYELVNSDGYSDLDKVEINLCESIRLHNLVKSIRFEDPEKSIKLLLSSAIIHMRNLYLADNANHIKADKINEYSRNTIFLFLLVTIKNGDMDSFLQFLNESAKLEDAYFDPLTQPLVEYAPQFKNALRSKEKIGRTSAAIDRLLKRFKKKDSFMYPNNFEDSLRAIEELKKDLEILMRSKALKM